MGVRERDPAMEGRPVRGGPACALSSPRPDPELESVGWKKIILFLLIFLKCMIVHIYFTV